MRRHGIIGLLIAIAFLAPYTVSRYLGLAMGPWTGMAVSHNGTVTTLTSDVTMPPPAWLVLPPRTLVSQSIRTRYNNTSDTGGSLECVVPMELPALKAYFTETLTAQGFVVKDDGVGPIDEKTAAFLDIAGNMSGRRATGEEVYIHFRGVEGFFRKARQIQVGWKVPG